MNCKGNQEIGGPDQLVDLNRVIDLNPGHTTGVSKMVGIINDYLKKKFFF